RPARVGSGGGRARRPAEPAQGRGPTDRQVTPVVRPRRLRATPGMRRLVAEHRLHPADLVLPVFVKEGAREATPISSMPGVVQHTRDTLRKAAAEAASLGLGG